MLKINVINWPFRSSQDEQVISCLMPFQVITYVYASVSLEFYLYSDFRFYNGLFENWNVNWNQNWMIPVLRANCTIFLG